MLAILLTPFRLAIRRTTRQVAGEAFVEGLDDFRADLAGAIEAASADPGTPFVDRLRAALAGPAVEDVPVVEGKRKRVGH